MNAADLIAKLVEIERAIGNADAPKVRAMVLEAEEVVLRFEQQTIETLRENKRLRDLMENCERSSLFRLSRPRIAEDEAALMKLSAPLGAKRTRRDPFTIN
jgi:hypothetical protein